MRPCCAWLLAVSLVPAQAQAPAAGERERIAQERAGIAQRYEAAQRECEQRFAVTPCLNQARAERRAAQEQLSRRQAVFEEADRRQRAAERRRRINEQQSRLAEKQATAPMRAGVRKPAARSSGSIETSNVAAQPGRSAMGSTGSVPAVESADATAKPAPIRPRKLQDDAAEVERRQRQEQAYKRRADEAQAHREEVRRRNAERDAIKAPAAPLPQSAASR